FLILLSLSQSAPPPLFLPLFLSPPPFRSATAARVVVPLSAPPPALLAIVMVTFAVLGVRFPNWSSMRTVTAGAMLCPATALAGCCRNVSLLVGPVTMLSHRLVVHAQPLHS